MKDQIVFDCETMGIGRGKAIISIAALRFDLEDSDSLDALRASTLASGEFIANCSAVYASDMNLDVADLLFIKIPYLDSLRLGFESDKGTLDWWGRQPEELLRMNLTPTPIGGAERYLGVLSEWIALASKNLGPKGAIKGWANSPRFDFEMLEEYYRVLKKPFPIEFRNERDIRTVRAFFDLPYQDMKVLGLQAHNPIHDCFIQAYDVQRAHQIVRAHKAAIAQLTPVTLGVGNEATQNTAT